MADRTDVTRRDFLKHTGAAGVALAAAGCGGAGSEAPAAAPPPPAPGPQADAASAGGPAEMPRKRLGKTGRMVTVLGQGTALNVTPILLNRSLDAGVRYLDTAESYQNNASERAVGRILQANGKRDECFIVTKTGDHRWQNLEQHLDGSLERLQTDHVDVLYLHNLGNPALLNGQMAKEAERLIGTGKTKHFGFSCHHPRMLEVLDRAGDVDFVEVIMFKYNFHDYDNDRLNRVMDKCAKADIGLVAMKTQGGASSFPDRVDPFLQTGLSKGQAVLKAVWEDDRITSIVSAMRNVHQVEENAAAAKQPRLTAQQRELLHEYRLASRSMYCRGCGGECMPHLAAETNVPDVLRHLMYYENYGDRRLARELFGQLPAAERRIRGVDFAAAEAACPYGVQIGEMMRRAETYLA